MIHLKIAFRGRIELMNRQKDKFTDWLNSEAVQKRGWSFRQLADRAGSTIGTVSRVMNQHQDPTADFCHGIARALGVPPERVFRKAGLLPPHIIGDEDQDRKNELLDYYESLRDNDRDTAVALIRTLYEQRGPYAAELRPNQEEERRNQ